jgi:hypothetical protein
MQNTITLSLFICVLQTSKICTLFWGHFVYTLLKECVETQSDPETYVNNLRVHKTLALSTLIFGSEANETKIESWQQKLIS